MDRSWDPAHDILDPMLIREFRACQPNQPAARPRSKPRKISAPRVSSLEWGSVTAQSTLTESVSQYPQHVIT